MAKKGSNRKKKTSRVQSGNGKVTSRRSVVGRTTQSARVGRKRVRREDGPRTAGQSGSTQGLSRRPQADSESVEELLEEGQSFEAGVVSGVERASDVEGAETHTGEVPEDDLPVEYRNIREKEN